MANLEHLEVLRKGVETWNTWRDQNRGIRSYFLEVYPEVRLGGADLRGADFCSADLGGADLRGADLRGANLEGVNLSHTNLNRADLTQADLTYVSLIRADLSQANLFGANFFGADLREANLPLAFLRGCGLPEALIDYLPSLLHEPFQFYSCFISYASTDQAFAERLYGPTRGNVR